ncbi:hypothetical protein DYB32_000183 [Aphanomyces invadans]|uniref:D-serine dehydratase-like domain-containing protein n=1 Tax=Aphanomyces invadans TaxID=157072 RepID=A0A3R7D7S8_9STRA|nr:hypothetical protein DYB32_000183 [Aphanomyces invadans]
MSASAWVDTPAIVVDEDRLLRNIARMQEHASKNHVNLRPHAKTHKSIDIAKMILDAGAVGLTVSKPLEARKFIEAGFRDVTLAYPVVVEDKLDLTIRCAQQHDATLNLTVESFVGVQVAASSAAKNNHVLNVLIHVDVGHVAWHRSIQFTSAMVKLRPGNYIFQDRTPVRTGVSSVQNVSLTVVATVVSSNAHYFIIDAGSKVLSTDMYCSEHGSFGSDCYGLVFREQDFDQVTTEPTAFEWALPSGVRTVCFQIKKLSEEHGWVAHAPTLGPSASPQVGDRVTVLVNHSCPVVNLANRLSVKTKDGALSKHIELISRGCCQ